MVDHSPDQLFALMGRIEVSWTKSGFLAAMTKDGFVLLLPVVLKAMKLMHDSLNNNKQG